MTKKELNKFTFSLIRNIQPELLSDQNDDFRLNNNQIEAAMSRVLIASNDLALRIAVHLNRDCRDYAGYEITQIRNVFIALLDEIKWTGLRFTDRYATNKTILLELLDIAYRLKRPYSKETKNRSHISFEAFDSLMLKRVKRAATVHINRALAGVLHRFIGNLADTMYSFINAYENFISDCNVDDFAESIKNPSDIYLTAMCSHCDTLYIDRKQEVISVDGHIGYVCDSCKTAIHSCDMCGKQTFNNSVSSSKQEIKEFWSSVKTNKKHSKLSNGIVFCDECLRKYLSTCFSCGVSLLVTPPNTLNYEKGDAHACSTCRNPTKDTVTCEVSGCPNTFSKLHRKEILTHIYDGPNTADHHKMLQKYCDKHIAMLAAIHPYGYRPDKRVLMLHPKEVKQPNKLLLGFELEFAALDNNARQIIAVELQRTTGYNKFTVCLDGSVQSGAEIISSPFSFMFYKKRRKLFKNLWNMVTANGGIFTDPQVGFHVHTSKNAWSSMQVYKLVKFLQNRDEYCKLIAIFGRSPGQYNFISESDLHNVVKVAREKQNLSKQHYNNINMTGNQTIEFRMFAGPASVVHLLAYLEFCFAVYDWTAQVKSNELKAKHFIEFVINSKLYDNLRKLMLTKYDHLKGDRS